eukprot:CAMPEP_0119027696 /NCGR_PEP_ID=MMETSP1176-20130426/37585_1 /TAXON_ID=265551 /ORGANISM="Synedropsis recta cf, Strain CCMP1620" /LENGTH=288 /DNA_ID=CAMNT_0006983669 /DNA_START=199 /DNA_END=1062 /DNA_ORIENTATION=-
MTKRPSRSFNTAVGASFAIAYVCVLETVFQLAFAVEDLPTPKNSRFIGILVLLSACFNTLSHTAVVVGVLNDTYVVSILIGVGFDVLSTVLYLCMWWVLASSNAPTAGGEPTKTPAPAVLVLLEGLCLAITLLQWLTHIRALLLSSSAARLQSVVTSAWNNLRGEPGPSYQDHVFAYTDLAYHIFHTAVAVRLVFGWRSTDLVIRMLGVALTTIVVAIFLLGNRNLSTSPPNNQLPPGLLQISKEGKPVCSCDVCAIHDNKAFSIDFFRCELCQLWFQSFGQMCHILE